MKNCFTYFFAVALAILAVSCEEVNPTHFHDISGVYFNNRTGSMALTDSLGYTFVYEAGKELEVPVKVQLVGRPSDMDRPVHITVSSDNASEGVDYILPSESVLPAGATEFDYIVRLVRTPALKSETKMLRMQIHSNECFRLPIKEMIQLGDTVTTLKCRIYFSDMFTKAPVAWSEREIGVFTQQKFELICRVLEIDPADFNDTSKITLAKLVYIGSEMTSYVRSENEKRIAGKPYDEEIIDQTTGLPMVFNLK